MPRFLFPLAKQTGHSSETNKTFEWYFGGRARGGDDQMINGGDTSHEPRHLKQSTLIG